ncbi:RNA processing protein, variant 2 [Entomophthora muscae]|nr:RNA processing protein, variant 2 [Entomophthora muscae]
MNLTLREVIQTSPEGDRFWRLAECYIRGSTIKYLRVPDEVMDMVKANMAKKKASRDSRIDARVAQSTRGGQRGGRGRSQGQQRS